MMKYAIALSLFISSIAVAEPGNWFEPTRDGHGLQISQPTSGGHGIVWYLYNPDGSTTWLIGMPCDSFPCVTELYSPTARWMGGNLNLGEPVGVLEIGVAEEDVLPIRYDLRAFAVERCSNISAGGVLFRECAGRINLFKLSD